MLIKSALVAAAILVAAPALSSALPADAARASGPARRWRSRLPSPPAPPEFLPHRLVFWATITSSTRAWDSNDGWSETKPRQVRR